jgi:hypothetical protein
MEIDLGQMGYYHPMLTDILTDAEREFYWYKFRITSQYRPGDNGVHGQIPLRGTDISCRVDYIGRSIEHYINNRYQYDPARPRMRCCIYHDAGTGKHLHFQVHDNTVRKDV